MYGGRWAGGPREDLSGNAIPNRLNLLASSTIVDFPLQSESPEACYGGHSTLAPVALFRTHLDVDFDIGLRRIRPAVISREAVHASGSHRPAVAVSYSVPFPHSNARAVAAADRKD